MNKSIGENLKMAFKDLRFCACEWLMVVVLRAMPESDEKYLLSFYLQTYFEHLVEYRKNGP